MGAPDDSIREELIGAVLGELSLLRRDVGELRTALETSGKRFKDDSDLAVLRLASRWDQFLADFRDSTTEVLSKARDFGEAREQLMGEIAVRQYDQAHEQHVAMIREVLLELPLRAPSRLVTPAWVAGIAVCSAIFAMYAIALSHGL
ncbi:hypothetical protein [Caballeronia sp. GAWG1-1]|uniref:hypothetical protein n=1 Tax=Caballeronia sp. GAWG1-1 TaxID=2921742 RepID=UPI0020290E77|nr:hypothetical protein [Caballeronia sp. GAWG1-1]